MRILVVIAHFFGRKEPDDQHAICGSQIEPLSRIAALNASIVALYRNFGRISRTFEQVDLSTTVALRERELDVVILAKEGNSLLDHIGIGPSYYSVEYVDDALRIPFHAQQVIRDRLGRYDFYCVIEDDLIIHDPDFFEKLAWFDGHFGPRALLAPVRYEMSARGVPARVVIDPRLGDARRAPFLRPGQRPSVGAAWHGQVQVFNLPSNPHAGGYFLSNAQLAHWVAQSSFGDGDTSWIGPLESAMTLSVGKVFDIYKAAEPDPFFLAIEHYGTRFSTKTAVNGQVYGDPPILDIAQGALRAAAPVGLAAAPADLAELWQFQGVSADIEKARTRPSLEGRIASLKADLGRANTERNALKGTLTAIESSTSWRVTAPLRWVGRNLRSLTGKRSSDRTQQ
jgi:hypothetical protein